MEVVVQVDRKDGIAIPAEIQSRLGIEELYDLDLKVISLSLSP